MYGNKNGNSTAHNYKVYSQGLNQNIKVAVNNNQSKTVCSTYFDLNLKEVPICKTWPKILVASFAKSLATVTVTVY